MTHTADVTRRSRDARFWLAYTAAWLPYAVGYVAVFTADRPERTLLSAVEGALLNTGAAAVLGILVVVLCDRFPLRRRVRPGWIALQLCAAMFYSAAWWAAISLLLSLRAWLATGAWALEMLLGPALHWQSLAGLMVYSAMASALYASRGWADLRREETRVARGEELRVRAELAALRAQLQPHFLFNTLHSLLELVRAGDPRAEDGLERLSDLLRRVLRASQGEADDVSLREEWGLAEDYLALERLRLGDRLRVRADFEPAAMDCAVPSLTLQPLIENAIRHAVAPRTMGGTVWLSGRIDGQTLRLEVRDDGPGAASGAGRAGGLGLSVVRQRLESRFGAAGGMEVITAPGDGWTVVVRIPIETLANVSLEGVS